MKNATTVGAALMLTTTAAYAGGIDRGSNAYSVLYEDGSYVELSFSSVTPDVSGSYDASPWAPGSTGNMAEDYLQYGIGLKYELNDQFDLGLFLNQPYGASANYPDGDYAGLRADWKSHQVAVVLKYQATPNVSVYGGVRSINTKAEIDIPDTLNRAGAAQALAGQAQAAGAAGDATRAAQLGGAAQAIATGTDGGPSFAYSATTSADRRTSYIAGAAYERPEIALRVALTYETGYTHTFNSTETIRGTTTNSSFDIEMPQSVTLDFQSGVAEDTLVFGSVRWSEWSVWEVRPAAFEAFSGDRVTGIDNDVLTYRVGVGRRINEDLSVFARVTYEDGNGDVASRLSPTDGSTALGVGGSYTFNDIKLTGGLEYIMLGDATDATNVEFADNTAVGVGLSIGYTF